MKRLKKIGYSVIVAAVLMTAACSQKEEDKKTKSRGGIGTGVGPQTQEQQAAAIAAGAQITINSITKSSIGYSEYSSDQTIQVTADIKIGNDSKTIKTNHSQQGGTQLNGQILPNNTTAVQIQVKAFCADVDCNWYYLMIEGYKGNQRLYQYAFLRDFQFGRDLYMMSPGNTLLTFDSMIQTLADSYN